jgi:hypothetical protein
MAAHTIVATITVEVTDPSSVKALGGGADERAEVQSAVDAGLKELKGVAQRYGFTITEANATVS